MERNKTIILVILVALSLFLSYRLMFDIFDADEFVLEIDDKNIISYKRFYSVNPNRESLLEIPNKDINELIVKSLADSNPTRVGDDLISSELKDEGYIAISAFDLPINMLFTIFKQKMPKLPFESFDRCYFTKNGDLFLKTENGVYNLKAKYILDISESIFDKCVLMDENFMPIKINGVNSYATIINPVENYSNSDRLQLANGFLKESVAEIIEDDSYLFSTEEESLRIFANGTIHYLSATPHDKTKTTLYDSLVALRLFIKKSPLNFSNYRILNVFEEDNNFLFYLSDSALPFYVSDNAPIVVNITGGKITSFSYNSKFLREFDKIYLEPDAKIYRDIFKRAGDPILVYTEEESSDGRAILSTIDTR